MLWFSSRLLQQTALLVVGPGRSKLKLGEVQVPQQHQTAYNPKARCLQQRWCNALLLVQCSAKLKLMMSSILCLVLWLGCATALVLSASSPHSAAPPRFQDSIRQQPWRGGLEPAADRDAFEVINVEGNIPEELSGTLFRFALLSSQSTSRLQLECRASAYPNNDQSDAVHCRYIAKALTEGQQQVIHRRRRMHSCCSSSCCWNTRNSSL